MRILERIRRATERLPTQLTASETATGIVLATAVGVAAGLGAKDVGRIPVVDRDDRTRLLGVLRRHDIIKAYRKRLEESTQRGRGY